MESSPGVTRPDGALDVDELVSPALSVLSPALHPAVRARATRAAAAAARIWLMARLEPFSDDLTKDVLLLGRVFTDVLIVSGGDQRPDIQGPVREPHL